MRGRGKGPQFERDFARRLSLWWTEDKRDDVFWRTSQSGGRAKTRKKTGKNTFGQYGDIQATDPIGRPLLEVVTIELKKGYSNEPAFNAIDRLPQFGQDKPCQWERFLEQVMGDSENAGTPYWLLVHKRDCREAIAFIPDRLWQKLVMYVVECPCVCIYLPKVGHIFGLRITDFFQNVRPEKVRELLRKTFIIRKRV